MPYMYTPNALPDGAEPLNTAMQRLIARFNENHGADGKFASGGGGESGGSGSGGGGGSGGSGGGLSANQMQHVTGDGPVDGSHTHTVSVSIDGEELSFTDQWTKGDISQMLQSDFATTFHGKSKYLDSLGDDLVGRHDSAVFTANDGTMVMFHNNPLSPQEENDIQSAYRVAAYQHERASGAIGSYDNETSSEHYSEDDFVDNGSGVNGYQDYIDSLEE